MSASSLHDSSGSERERRPRPILVLGLGNRLIADDAVAAYVIDEVKKSFEPSCVVECAFCEEMGLSLLDWITDRRVVILVDAVQSGRGEPGSWLELDVEAIPASRTARPHAIGVREALDLGRTLGLAMPERVRIFAIEVVDLLTIGGGLSPAVQAAVPQVAKRIVELINSLPELQS